MPSKKDPKEPAPVNGRLSFLAPETCRVPDDAARSSKVPARALPTTGTEWIQLATDLLGSGNSDTQGRAIDICAAAAAVLLEEAARKDEAAARSRRASMQLAAQARAKRRQVHRHGDDDDEDEADVVNNADSGRDPSEQEFSPFEGDGVAATPTAAAAASAPPSTLERVEAAYVLVAGAVAAMERDSADAVDRAVALAEQASRAAPSAMASVTLAWAWVRASGQLPERGAKENALASATSAAASAADALLARGTLDKDDGVWLVRAGWVLASLGESEPAKLCVNRLLSTNPRHLMGLLLLALLHSAEGDTTSAMRATVRLVQAYPSDIAGGLLLTALRLSTGESMTSGGDDGGLAAGTGTSMSIRSTTSSTGGGAGGTSMDSNDTLQEELGVAMARVQAFAAAVTAGEGFARKRTLKSFCTHPAPGEEEFGAGAAAARSGTASPHTLSLTLPEARRRAGQYWAFLAHCCARAGAVTLAEVAVEAGLSFVASATGPLHRRAFADLLCTRTRLALLTLRDKIPHGAFIGTGSELRELNLLGSIVSTTSTATSAAARAANASLLALQAEVRGASLEVGGAGDTARGAGVQEPLADASRLLHPRDLAAVFTYLVKAEEACPHHAEARYLMGVVRLLESSQPDLPRKDRDQRQAAAAQFFTEALRMAPAWADPHLGLGCVMEAQGANEAAVDVYASAAELSLCEPHIPYERMLFLFE